VRATNNAMEHEPRRQGDIQAILRRLEERAPELIAAAVRAARGATEAQLEMEV